MGIAIRQTHFYDLILSPYFKRQTLQRFPTYSKLSLNGCLYKTDNWCWSLCTTLQSFYGIQTFDKPGTSLLNGQMLSVFERVYIHFSVDLRI